jgi:hypothetical protein
MRFAPPLSLPERCHRSPAASLSISPLIPAKLVPIASRACSSTSSPSSSRSRPASSKSSTHQATAAWRDLCYRLSFSLREGTLPPPVGLSHRSESSKANRSAPSAPRPRWACPTGAEVPRLYRANFKLPPPRRGGGQSGRGMRKGSRGHGQGWLLYGWTGGGGREERLRTSSNARRRSNSCRSFSHSSLFR